MSAVLLAALLSCAAPEPRVTYGALTWKIVLVQAGDVKKDVWGGRVTANLRLYGGLHAVVRLDASALPGDPFEPSEPDTYKAFEGYGGFYHGFNVGGAQLGPAAIYGLTRGFDLEGAELIGNPQTYGGGMRLGYRRAWLYVLAAKHEAAGDGARLLAATQIQIWSGMTIVADVVGGEGGFVRVGVGYQLGSAP